MVKNTKRARLFLKKKKQKIMKMMNENTLSKISKPSNIQIINRLEQNFSSDISDDDMLKNIADDLSVLIGEIASFQGCCSINE